MKKPGRIRQRDNSDCGAACLASVFANYGFHLPVSKIRQWAATDQSGTSIYGLLQAARKAKMEARAVRATIDLLPALSLPAIAHVITEKSLNHFVVVCSANENGMVVMEPAIGNMSKMSYEKFESLWTGALVMMIPGRGFQTNRKNGNWKKITQIIRSSRRALALALVCAVIFSLLGLAIPLYLKKIVDTVLEQEGQKMLPLFSIAMVAMLVLQYAAGLIKGFLAVKTSQAIDTLLVLGYYQHLLHLPQTFFDRMQTGEMVSRINDAVRINLFINEIAMNAFIDVLILLFSGVLMFVFYWKLALLMLVVVPGYAILFYLSNSVNKKYQRRIMESGAELESLFVQNLQSASTIKRLGIENYVFEKIREKYGVVLNLARRSSLANVGIHHTADFSTRLFTLIILWVGCYYVLENKMSKGELLSFYALIIYFTGPVLALLGTNKNIRDAMIAADRLFEITDLEKEDQGNRSLAVHDQNQSKGNIEFNDVSFRYDNGKLALQHIQLVIPSGSCLGIKGESGSGKSTLTALLMKLYAATEGTITIDGVDIQEIKTTNLRSMVVSVPQVTELFTGSIRQNIVLDRDDDSEKLQVIAEQLGMIDFIQQAPAGYDTIIQEQGTNLSGGQRQKISIARALYREPSILVLDEPTASLDRESENKIMQTIEWWKGKGNTIIIVTHSDVALKICDNIVILKNGKVV